MNTDQNIPPHPLEEVFGIESGTTHDQPLQIADQPVLIQNESVPTVDPISGEIIHRSSMDEPDYDREERVDDLHIDKQLETIHNSALIAYEKQQRMADEVDPRFAARNAEVAATFLNIALNSVNTRIDAKYKRNKIRITKEIKGNTPHTVNNNLIVGDREEILEKILNQQVKEKVVQTVPVEEKKNEDKSTS